MLTLQCGNHHGLRVAPRWPSTHIQIEAEVLQCLLDAQALLPSGLGLLVTRGFESGHSRLGGFRRAVRRLGIALFRTCYPQRRDEVDAIFGANGHDIDGRHVDVSLVLHGQRLRLLPLGVFTPPVWQARRVARHAEAIARVKHSLQQCGFDLHHNPTEALQIHCDYRGNNQVADGRVDG
ncbi:MULTISPECIES: hypothetical protein [unclassified Stenotrophomonas]|uniref:hypothetical protein n=1 Tax=unclassified Stenotrophomonas TaxID=196198 RepID=UPI000D158B88|nr:MULTISPECIES: hypothetical protein [unclassified Stenotrophomonas]PTA70040.1 hypothetical protein C9412_19935 [Stenotrophomonas sp. Nf1]PTA77559.1 hypothetical protein C9416_15255 [Stenotrophomonas sp. Nf4]